MLSDVKLRFDRLISSGELVLITWKEDIRSCKSEGSSDLNNNPVKK